MGKGARTFIVKARPRPINLVIQNHLTYAKEVNRLSRMFYTDSGAKVEGAGATEFSMLNWTGIDEKRRN